MKYLLSFLIITILSIDLEAQVNSLPFLDDSEPIKINNISSNDSSKIVYFVEHVNHKSFICKPVSDLIKELNINNYEIFLANHYDLTYKDVELIIHNNLISLQIKIDNIDIIPSNYNKDLLPHLLNKLEISSIKFMYLEKYYLFTNSN